MTRYVLLISLLTALAAAEHTPVDGLIHEAGYCVTYGMADNGLPLLDNKPVPFIYSTELFSVMLETCPHLAFEARLCCDEAQLDFLKGSLENIGALVRSCPSCFNNFKALFCDLVCSPNQSLFTEVVNATSDAGGVEHVTKFNYYLSNHFAKTLHKSCVDTSYMLCMQFFSPCTLEQLYNYLGDNHFTELKINFIIGDDDVTPFVRAESDYMRIECNEPTPEPEVGCDRPSISGHSLVEPAISVASGSNFNVTCLGKSALSGPAEILCTNGTLSTIPTCEEPLFAVASSSPLDIHSAEKALDDDVSTYTATSPGSSHWYRVYFPKSVAVGELTFKSYCFNVGDVFKVSLGGVKTCDGWDGYRCRFIGEITHSVQCDGEYADLELSMTRPYYNRAGVPLILYDIAWSG